MKILSHQNMQHIHTIRIWTVNKVQIQRAKDDRDYYDNNRYNEPDLTTTEEELTHFIWKSMEEFSGFNGYQSLMEIFGDDDGLADYVMETFKQENELLQ